MSNDSDETALTEADIDILAMMLRGFHGMFKPNDPLSAPWEKLDTTTRVRWLDYSARVASAVQRLQRERRGAQPLGPLRFTGYNNTDRRFADEAFALLGFLQEQTEALAAAFDLSEAATVLRAISQRCAAVAALYKPAADLDGNCCPTCLSPQSAAVRVVAPIDFTRTTHGALIADGAPPATLGSAARVCIDCGAVYFPIFPKQKG